MQIQSFKTELGKRIREERKQRNLSQSELAIKAKTTQANISAIERGALDNPSFELVQRILFTMDMKLRLQIQSLYMLNRDAIFLIKLHSLDKRDFPPCYEGELEKLRDYIGTRIMLHRKIQRISQAALAEKSKTTQAKISLAERGLLNYSFKCLIKVLEALRLFIACIDIKYLHQSDVPRQIWNLQRDSFWRKNYKRLESYKLSYHKIFDVSIRDRTVTNADRKQFYEERALGYFDDWRDYVPFF